MGVCSVDTEGHPIIHSNEALLPVPSLRTFFFFFFLCWALDTERAWQMLSARFLLSGWQENSA